MADHDQTVSYFGFSGAAMLECFSGPQVYRFLFRDKFGKHVCSYIGETNSFRRRLAGYRGGLKPTERYLRSRIDACKSLEHTVEIQFLTFDLLDFGGVLILPEMIGINHVRHMLESWAVLCDYRANIRILNKTQDLILRSPGHPIDHIEETAKSRASFFRDLDEADKRIA